MELSGKSQTSAMVGKISAAGCIICHSGLIIFGSSIIAGTLIPPS